MFWKRLLFPCLTLLMLTVKAQVPPDSLVALQANKYPIEKIYFHLDKQAYVAGETIWYKAYIQINQAPSNISTVLCVELLNDSGRVLQKQVLPIINSCAAGNFSIPPDNRQMRATLRAYTRQLQNYGTAFFSQRIIPIYNPSNTKTATRSNRHNQIHFLPEGGNFVATVNNVVAFKAQDGQGYPVDVTGVVTDSRGAEVANFKAEHDGMGSFQLIAIPGERYKATVLFAGETAAVVEPLPEPMVSGATFQVFGSATETYFLVNTETVFNDALRPVSLVAVMNDAVVFKADLPVDRKLVKAFIPVNELPGGLLQLTLFNKDGQPLAERLMYIRKGNMLLSGSWQEQQTSLKPRGKNSYAYTLEDTLNGTFSVSVVDAGSELPNDDQESIFSVLRLKGELNGYVYQPDYYFQSDDAEHQRHLDLVMLTNGWRRFNWEELAQRRLPPLRTKDVGYINLEGVAFNEVSKEPLANAAFLLNIRTKDTSTTMQTITTDSAGHFLLEGMIFQDTASLTFRLANQRRNTRPVIQVTSTPVAGFFPMQTGVYAQPRSPLDFTISKERLNSLYASTLVPFDDRVLTMEAVTVKTRTKSVLQQVEERYIKNPMFNNAASRSLDLVNDATARNYAANIFEFLKARLASVTIRGSGVNYTLNYRNTMSLTGGMLPMALFLNEAQVTSDILATIPASQVALVKVYPQGFIGSAGNSPGGALAIYTREGADVGVAAADASIRYALEGFSPVKEFFSPDYSSMTIKADDIRTTLYWNPYLRTSPSEKTIPFFFYNSDHTKQYRLVLEGMTEDGRLLHVEKIVE